MSTETVATLFAVCLIAGLVGSVGLYARPATRRAFVDAAPWIAAAVAVGATFGSLYFSERAGFIPCKLCWYQRIAMYPMAVILPLAAFRRDRQIMMYSFVLAAVGLAISIYHITVQLFPEQSNFCEFNNPCSAKWVEAFGVITIPQMAAMSFVLIMALSLAVILDRTEQD